MPTANTHTKNETHTHFAEHATHTRNATRKKKWRSAQPSDSVGPRLVQHDPSSAQMNPHVVEPSPNLVNNPSEVRPNPSNFGVPPTTLPAQYSSELKAARVPSASIRCSGISARLTSRAQNCPYPAHRPSGYERQQTSTTHIDKAFVSKRGTERIITSQDEPRKDCERATPEVKLDRPESHCAQNGRAKRLDCQSQP